MMPISTNSTAPKKTVSPRHALLEELIGIVTRHLNDQYLDLFAKLGGALIDATDGDTRAMQQRIRAGNMLRNSSMAFLHLASGMLEKTLRCEIALLAPAPQARSREAAQPLGLVPYEEMDNKVAVGGISKPFEVLYGDSLQTLNVRLAFLLERDILRLNQNPFRPDVFLVALQQAWLEFDTDPESANLLLPLLKPGMFLDLGPMLEALNLALQRKGVLPGSVDGYKGRKADVPPAPAFSPAPARGQQAALAQQLRQFFAASGVGATEEIDLGIPDIPAGAVVTGGAWVQGAAQGFHGAQDNEAARRQSQVGAKRPLLSYLAQLQHAMPAVAQMTSTGIMAAASAMSAGYVTSATSGNASPGNGAAAGQGGQARPANVFYLPRLKESMPQGSLSRADESTIDLLSAIFDTVFQDQSISQEIRDLIRFLQIPVLKAALVDKDFFFQEAHPARRLIDLLSRMGWEQRKGPEDPLFQAMQRSVDRVGRDYDHELSVFTEAVDELEASIKAEEAAAAAAIAEPIAAALKQERMAEAGRSARDAVALRIGTGEVVAVVEAFLENKWVSVLTIAYSVDDDKPGAVNSATRTMDELIWSVKPKLSAPERKRLIAKLPSLLSSLNKWLDIIKWQDADRLQFFAELAECHASIVRAPLELAPERQVELAMQAAQQAAERRLELQARQAQAQTAAPAPQAHDDEAVIEVDSLARGMWVEFAQPDGGRRKVKLAWISPLRTLYIFSTAARQEAFSMSGLALAAQFRDGGAQLVRSEGVVAMALTQAMSQAAVNDPAIAAQRSAYA
ncbi:DUF1631 family protein [Rugamonas sp.]|uniref:DUF1631 family protein n=1 Tax=Rugamonas sp. TaxID=1926287 RepID=UPI0025E9EA6C|nr:DUF1631 family protein [Rugamonas sp.]